MSVLLPVCVYISTLPPVCVFTLLLIYFCEGEGRSCREVRSEERLCEVRKKERSCDVKGDERSCEVKGDESGEIDLDSNNENTIHMH